MGSGSCCVSRTRSCSRTASRSRLVLLSRVSSVCSSVSLVVMSRLVLSKLARVRSTSCSSTSISSSRTLSRKKISDSVVIFWCGFRSPAKWTQNWGLDWSKLDCIRSISNLRPQISSNSALEDGVLVLEKLGTIGAVFFKSWVFVKESYFPKLQPMEAPTVSGDS